MRKAALAAVAVLSVLAGCRSQKKAVEAAAVEAEAASGAAATVEAAATAVAEGDEETLALTFYPPDSAGRQAVSSVVVRRAAARSAKREETVAESRRADTLAVRSESTATAEEKPEARSLWVPVAAGIALLTVIVLIIKKLLP